MNFLINYWWMLIVSAAIGFSIGVFIYSFRKKSKEEQIKKVKEWLIYPIVEAEKLLGGGTGKIKLKVVYDCFLTKFPYLAKIISFEQFSSLVDLSLAELKEMLKSNQNLKDYIEGKDDK